MRHRPRGDAGHRGWPRCRGEGRERGLGLRPIDEYEDAPRFRMHIFIATSTWVGERRPHRKRRARRAMRCRKLWDAAALSRGRAPMAPDRSYIAENDRERRRLEQLVGELDDAALGRPIPEPWERAGYIWLLA